MSCEVAKASTSLCWRFMKVVCVAYRWTFAWRVLFGVATEIGVDIAGCGASRAKKPYLVKC